MVTAKVYEGKLVYLRSVSLQDCTDRYVKWLNDPDVNRFLETRWQEQNLNSIIEYVKGQMENDNSYLFAIVTNNTDLHIGNVKIGPVNNFHHRADISYFIGDKTMWGKGVATEVIRLACNFGFKELNLHRIEAGAYSEAVGSWKALERIGFKREGVLHGRAMVENEYMDVFWYAILKDDFHNRFLTI